MPEFPQWPYMFWMFLVWCAAPWAVVIAAIAWQRWRVRRRGGA